jgi:exodeoxyribonuclease-3
VIVRLLTYNILRGGAGREELLRDVIAASNPDLVLLQEATRPGIIQRLAASTGMTTWGTRPRTSLGFMSRLDVADYGWHRPRASRHAFLEVRLAGSPARIFGVHLSAVHAAWTEQRRVFELRALLSSIRRHEPGMHVLAGDFNTLAPGELLDIRKLPYRLRGLVWLSGGKIRWRTIQILLDAGYVDVGGTRGTTPAFTFPTWSPHLRLDYIFVPAQFGSSIRSCRVVSDAMAVKASDHFPLLAEVALPS